MFNTFFQGGAKNFQGSSPPLRLPVYGPALKNRSRWATLNLRLLGAFKGERRFQEKNVKAP